MRQSWVAAGITICLLLTACSRPEKHIRAFGISELENFGRQIFEQVEAKARSNPLIMAEEARKGAGRDRIRGWIVRGNKVRWLRDGKDGLEVAYDVVSPQGASPRLSAPGDRRLSADEISQWAAQTRAWRSVDKLCGAGFDFATARDRDGNWLVWVLAADPQHPEKSFLGGHYRFTISGDGGKILQRDELSTSCFVMQRSDDSKDGQEIPAQFFAQTVSGIPVETAVWQNLRNRVPLLIVTPDRMRWRIESGRIEKMGPLLAKSP